MLKKTQTKNWRAYCKVAFNSLHASKEFWGDPDFYRPITRHYYISVFDCGAPNPTGLISENALKNKLEKKKTVYDHYLSPQFICRMIMDNPDVYLEDYKKFEQLFWISAQTVVVTQQENDSLAMLTENDGENYIVKVPTNLKYQHLGIKLLERPANTKLWKNSQPISDNVLDVPQELLDYEKQFLLTS